MGGRLISLGWRSLFWVVYFFWVRGYFFEGEKVTYLGWRLLFWGGGYFFGFEITFMGFVGYFFGLEATFWGIKVPNDEKEQKFSSLYVSLCDKDLRSKC